MGWVKQSIACLSGCSIRLKIKCKNKCCESNCMLEETPAKLSNQDSSSSSVDNKNKKTSNV